MSTLKYHVKRLFRYRKMADLAKLEKFSDKSEEIEQLYQVRMNNVAPVKEPFVLIGQIQRSGGTLLSQLFEGHPQLWCHPYELYIGYPRKWNWPDLNLSDNPETWFERLFEKYTVRHFREGYVKYGKGVDDDPDVFPFMMLPNLLKETFLRCAEEWEIKSQRDVLDCYFTAYFNAWLDYQGYYSAKKYVVAFAPRVNMYDDSIDRFFRDYPDGRMISMVRNPHSWYVSCHRHSPKQYPDPETALESWNMSTEATLRHSEKYPDKTCLLSFEKLLDDTEGTMRRLARFLDLDWSEALTVPTFQGMSIKADSSFKVDEYGVIKDPLDRTNDLSKDEITLIDDISLSLFDKATKALDLSQKGYCR